MKGSRTKKKKVKRSQVVDDPMVYRVISYLQEGRYEPSSPDQLFQRMRLSAQQADSFVSSLVYLQKLNKIRIKKGEIHFVERPSAKRPLEGTLSLHRRGFGFVNTHIGEVFIPIRDVGNAVHGDRVAVCLVPPRYDRRRGGSEKGMEGKVSHVIERKQEETVGIVFHVEGEDIRALLPVLGEERYATLHPSPGQKVSVGDRLRIRVVDWGSHHGEAFSPVQGIPIAFLPHLDQSQGDVEFALQAFGIPSGFSQECLDVLEQVKERASHQEGRISLVELPTVTIDPASSKDFDDAVSLQKDRKGNLTVYVHVADVGHYICADSALDLEAKRRCNTTYLPGHAATMIPSILADDLCSLVPHQERLTVTVSMMFRPSGELVDYSVQRSKIRSDHRYNYDEVQDILDGKVDHQPYQKMVLEMDDFAQLLRQKRESRGCLDFSLDESAIELDEEGMPTGFSVVEHTRSHQLIEEFMIQANEVVAQHIAEQGETMLYRVHQRPDSKSIEGFVEFARLLGHRIPHKPSPLQIGDLLRQVTRPVVRRALAIYYIRCMKPAHYATDNVGHFGLALDAYCHFTSPIRRYADVIVHRLITGDSLGDCDFGGVAVRCSECERNSSRAERFVLHLKRMRYLRRLLDESPVEVYEGTIRSIGKGEISFEIQSLGYLEATVTLDEKRDGHWIFNAKKNLLVNRDTGEEVLLLDSISVRLVKVDLLYLKAEWRMVLPAEDDLHEKRPRRKNKRSVKHCCTVGD